MVSPFQVDVPDAVLADLRERLARTRWPAQLDDAGWGYGTELSYLQQLCEYWHDEFDWRAAEARINEWPQFETAIDGERMHFIHAALARIPTRSRCSSRTAGQDRSSSSSTSSAH